MAEASTRTFKQQRSAQTYDALIAAAGRVFATKGFEGTQAADVAAAAGVSTGAFYRYFRDKQQAFLEMLDAHLSRERMNVRAALSADRFVGTDTCAAIDMVLDVLFDSVERNAAIGRVYIPASLTIPEVAALRAASEAEDRATVARLVAATVPREIVPSPEAAAVVIQVAALEVAAERAGLRPRKGPPVAAADLKLALRQMLQRYLFPGAPEPPARGRMKKK